MSKKKTRASKKLTISELKAYIEGAVELNPDGWAPNAEQWENIVEMIMNVKENHPVAVHVQSNEAAESPRNYQQDDRAEVRQVSQAPQIVPSNMQANPQEQFRPLPPSIDASQNPAVRPQMERTASQMMHDPATGTVSSGLKFKTPTIDTSAKPYTSGYE